MHRVIDVYAFTPMIDEVIGEQPLKVGFQLLEMFLERSAVRAFGRRLIGQHHTPTHITFPTVHVPRNMFLGHKHLTLRCVIHFNKLFPGRSAVRAFGRRHHAIINMAAFLTFPSYKSVHTYFSMIAHVNDFSTSFDYLLVYQNSRS